MAAIHQYPPIDNLPDELFVAVFGHCVRNSESYTSMDTRESPWLVSRVCSRWRRIALDTPSLWSKIALGFSALDDAYEESMGEDGTSALFNELALTTLYITLLRCQLDRSKDLPLTVYVSTTRGMDQEAPTDYLEEIAALLSVHSHRIHDLNIQDRSWALSETIDALDHPWDLSSLHHLEATLGDDSNVDTPFGRSFISLLRSAINLPTARFTYYVPRPSDLDWSRLTNLFIENSNTSDVYSIFPSLVRLQNLTISRTFEGDAYSPLELEPVILPCLEKTFCCSAVLLQLITAPNLQRFYPPLYGADDSEVHAVISFLVRSRCSVDTLYMSSDSHPTVLTPGAVIQLLDINPDLHQLHWSHGNPLLNTYVIDALAARDESGLFRRCPKLQHLYFNLGHVYPASLMGLIERRWEAGKRNYQGDDSECLEQGTLQKVEIVWSQDLLDHHIATRVERLSLEGMDIATKEYAMYAREDLGPFIGWGR